MAGFTLLEMLLVVWIIGTLAAISIPPYQDYTVRARISEGLTLGAEAERSVSQYYDRWGVMPTDNEAAGLPPADAMTGLVVTSIAIEDGAIVLRFGGKGLPRRHLPLTLILHPAVNQNYPTGPLVWVCNEQPAPKGFAYTVIAATKSNIENRYVPAGCRA